MKWARESLSNWIWLRDYTEIMYAEYQYRYNDRSHKSGELIDKLIVPQLIDIGLTRRPMMMPDQYKSDDIIKAYRDYYIHEKFKILKYTKRNQPYWLLEENTNEI